MKDIELSDVKIIFKAVVGSRAQGLATEKSDWDYKGVYIQDNKNILSYGYKEFINNGKDETYYEIRRFLDLLIKGNPEALQLLYSEKEFIVTLEKEFIPVLENRDKFLTKKCAKSFAAYGFSQIRKSKGANKKINWEIERIERKTPLDFCYIMYKNDTVPLNDIVKNQSECGLSKLNHADNAYGLYLPTQDSNYRGIISEDSNELRLSSIEKGVNPDYILFYNKNGYSTHCKDYKSYQDWLINRNLNRLNVNKAHGQMYDSKNVLHCKRLVDIAKEIAVDHTIHMIRPNNEYLFKIKNGQIPLDVIVNESYEDIKKLDELYNKSNLPEEVDEDLVFDLLLKIRNYEQ